MSRATEKQKAFAEAIAETLDIPLPDQDDKDAYSEFIDEWKDDYRFTRFGR